VIPHQEKDKMTQLNAVDVSAFDLQPDMAIDTRRAMLVR
jgi:hypothetical protein